MIPLLLIGAAYLIGKTMEGESFENGGSVPLLAPNGKPSNLTPEQWHLVRTPKFKAWFGDWENDIKNASKVVDENGEPLVVYRGFNSKSNKGNIFKYGVNRFKHNRLANRFAHYFTRSKKVAYEYAMQGEMVSENDIIIKEYFLRCNNLLDITTSNPKFPKFEDWVKSREALFSYSPYDVVEKLKNRQVPLHSYLFESVINDNNENDINKLSELKIKELQKRIAKEEKIQKEIYTDSQELNLYYLVKMISGKELNEIFKEQYNEHEAEGRRGIYNWFIHFKPNDVIAFDDLDIFLKDLIIENNYQGGKFLEFQFGAKTKKDKEVYFVFEPTQIKLADGTNTTFDGSNPDIRYEEGGVIVGENDGNNKFPTKSEAFELIQDSIESQGRYFIDKNGDGMFTNKKQALKYVDEIYDFFDYFYSMGMIPIYRGVKADEVDLDPYSIGESWSLYLDNAKRFASYLGSSKELKIISAYVPKNNVDWDSAFKLYPLFSDFGDSDSEFELPIPSNNKLINVTVLNYNDAKELEAYKFKKGGRTIAQTPAPKSDRIYGSKVNAKGSASSEKSASKIVLSYKIIDSLKKKLSENKNDNVTLNDLKAVYRRGLGAYSSSHRPTISGGKPNTRNAWAMARVNKFLLKASGVKVKKAYVQDDDLL